MAAYVPAPLAQVHIDAIRRDIQIWLCDEIARDARRYAPRDTGYLKAHIGPSHNHTRVTAPGAGMPPNADAPAHVEFGTQPHEIPNAFGIEGLTVQHPGTEPQPYLRPAAYTRRRVPPSIIHSRANWAAR